MFDQQQEQAPTEQEQGTLSSQERITSRDVFNTDRFQSRDQASQQQAQGDKQQAQVEQAIHDLEKLGKFKFEGQEWTAKDLRDAILRQKDYTQKTQALSKDRESFSQEQKFYENLYQDLNSVKNNPQLAQEFIKIYPEKFHSYLKQILEEDQNQTQSQNVQKPQQQQFDVDREARMQKLEKFYQDQEVAKNEAMISQTVEKFSKKYPDALKEVVIGRVYEAHNRGEQINDDTWETAFKTVDAQMKDMWKAKYGEMVKQQTEVNKKSQDVPSGGGTIGRAPAKFNKFSDITENAIRDLTSR